MPDLPDTRIFKGPRAHGRDFFNRVAFYLLHEPPGPLDLVTRYAVSRALAAGVKVFRPRPEDCRGLEHTEPHVQFADYQQPFPAVVYEWPAEYRREKAAEGVRLPPCTLAYHLPGIESVLLDSFSGVADHLVKLASPRYPAAGGGMMVCDTIEAALGTGGVQGAARHLEAGSRLLTRLAINFGLLLVGHGCREVGPAAPGGHLRRPAGHRTRLQRLLAGLDRQPVLVAFDQNVCLFEDPHPPGPDRGGDAAGPSPKPHWRRGHIRRQRCGPGNAQVKTVFVRAVLVRRSAFAGDLSDTRVTYDVRGAMPKVGSGSRRLKSVVVRPAW